MAKREIPPLDILEKSTTGHLYLTHKGLRSSRGENTSTRATHYKLWKLAANGVNDHEKTNLLTGVIVRAFTNKLS